MACCPSIWWCTPTGPVEVTPDGDGVYTRPAGATGHPFRSLAEALEVCPYAPLPPVSLTCSPDELTVPGSVDLTLTDLTGDYVGLFSLNTVRVLINTPFDNGFGTNGILGVAFFYDVNGYLWVANIGFICQGCDSDELLVSVSIGPTNPGAFGGGCGVGTYSTVGANGWTGGGGSGGTKCQPRSGPQIVTEKIGTVTYACPSFNGSFDLYTS